MFLFTFFVSLFADANQSRSILAASAVADSADLGVSCQFDYSFFLPKNYLICCIYFQGLNFSIPLAFRIQSKNDTSTNPSALTKFTIQFFRLFFFGVALPLRFLTFSNVTVNFHKNLWKFFFMISMWVLVCAIFFLYFSDSFTKVRVDNFFCCNLV